MSRYQSSAVVSTTLLPQPQSAFVGPLAEPWALVRVGRLRAGAQALAAIDPAGLGTEVAAQHAFLLLACRLGLGDIASAALSGDQLSGSLGSESTEGTLAHLAHGDLATALGDHQVAVEHYRAAGATSSAEDPDIPQWRAGAVVALVRTGQRNEAVELARELVSVAEEISEPYLVAIALRTLAAADSSIDPIRTLERAAGLAAHSSDLRLTSQIHADLAGLRLLAPEANLGDSLERLREAESFATSEGLWPLHARITRLLARAGERARPLPSETLAVLTNAEQRVAQLAAQGLTNRQIAEQLTVTIKGVEWHLSRVYRKLGIASRNGLGALLEVAPQPRSETA